VSFGWASQQILRNPIVPQIAVLAASPRCFANSGTNRTDVLVAMLVCVAGRSHVVYVLRSTIDPRRYYTGLSTSVAAPNGGAQLRWFGVHAQELRPWTLVVSIEFTSESSAIAFEKYLKSGSGRAFAKKHFL
jgi:putative endonuclease